MRVLVLFCALASALAFSNQSAFKSEFTLQLNEAGKTSNAELEMVAHPEAPPENDEDRVRRKLMSRP